MSDPLRPFQATQPSQQFIPKKLSELELTEAVTLLLWGAGGSGKTFYLGSAGPRTLILTTGHGMETLKDRIFRNKFPNSDPYVEVVDESVEDFISAGNSRALDRAAQHINNYIKNGLIDTFALDSGTDYSRFARWKGLIMGKEYKGSKTFEAQKAEKAFLLQVGDMGSEIALLSQFIDECCRTAKKNNINFILTAHERYFYRQGTQADIGKDPSERVNKITPAFTGQSFPEDINKYFALVWRMEQFSKTAGGNYYKIYTDGNELFSGRNDWKSLFKDEIVLNFDGDMKFNPRAEKDVYLPEVINRIRTQVIADNKKAKEAREKEQEALSAYVEPEKPTKVGLV